SEARVAVIGATLKEKLFGSDNALEQYIKIGQRNFRVVGVLERQGGSMFFDMDSIVFMPVRTLQKQILGIDYIQFFTVYLKDAAQAYATAADIEDILREEHKITDPKKDDFSVTTMDEAMDMLNTITGGITLLLSAIAAISLLVGGVGIMNI
ncbi:multidrug ABC transporter substrate-binding protein, partial [Candidatus Kuenenbacteria bacterium CG10_big_fil_rev_8_21_14_0_10_36_11]